MLKVEAQVLNIWTISTSDAFDSLAISVDHDSVFSIRDPKENRWFVG
jgi:hypothetical protein